MVDCLGADGCAVLVILDGRTFNEIARVAVPYRHCVSNNSTWVWERECANSCAIL